MKDKLSIDFLKSKATANSFQYGTIYFQRKRVLNVFISKSTIFGNVQGKQIYSSFFYYRDQKIVFNCSCPYQSTGLCKHLIAVGLEILNNPQKYNSNSEVINQPIIHLEQTLKKTSKEQIEKFLLDILMENKDYMERFIEMIYKPDDSKELHDILTNNNWDFPLNPNYHDTNQSIFSMTDFFKTKI